MSTSRRSLARWGWSVASAAALCVTASPAPAQEPCFERLDNGMNMTGWRKSTTNQHGPGDGWTVENGALVGRQTAGQQGGILMTDRSYGDVEAVFEVKVDWGCDSGFFLRTTDGNRAYQVTIDHLAESAVGAIWGEAFPQELREIPYWLTNDGTQAILAPNQIKTPVFDLEKWSSIWDPTDFNEIRARIEGNPPHIQVWIAGTKVMDFTDGRVRSEVAATGPLAIQVHNGSRWIEGGTVAFRNIRVRDLAAPCSEAGTGGAGGGAGNAAGGAPPTGGGTASGGTASGATAGGGAAPNVGGNAGAGGNPSGAGVANGGASAGAAAAIGGAPGIGGTGVAGSTAPGTGGGGPSTNLGGAGAGAGAGGADAARAGSGSGQGSAGAGDSGCSCRLPVRADGAIWPLAALFGVAALVRRARRRRLSD